VLTSRINQGSRLLLVHGRKFRSIFMCVSGIVKKHLRLLNVLKTCRICKQQKEITDFHKNKTRKDGRNFECKVCIRAKSLDWVKANPERYKELRVLSTKARLDAGLCRYCCKARLPNHERLCEYHYFAETAKQRIGRADKVTILALREKFEEQNHLCPYTEELLVLGVNAQLDHIKSAKNHPELIGDLGNVEWVSKKANIAKSSMNKDEFVLFCKKIALRF